MKKLMLLLIMITSLATSNELYAKGNSGKDKPERDKPERDKPKRDKPEKNIKAEDAQKNWGKLKDEYKDLDKSEQKEKKEEIKAKKRVTNELRKEIERNPDLDLTSIPEYDPNDFEHLVEKLINDYSDGEVNEETLNSLKIAGISDFSVNKIEKSLLYYNEKLDVLEDDFDEADTPDEEDSNNIEAPTEIAAPDEGKPNEIIAPIEDTEKIG